MTSPPETPSGPVASWEDELQPFREVALLTAPAPLREACRWLGRRLGAEALERFGLASDSGRPVSLEVLEAAGKDLRHLERHLQALAQSRYEDHLPPGDLPAAEAASRLAPLLADLAREIEDEVQAQGAAIRQETVRG